MNPDADIPVGGWEIQTDNLVRPRQAHVIPYRDVREHVVAADCWCHPKVLDGGLVVHQRLEILPE